ncbi:MAG: 16S rRNA (adenine(1518)-N(6)/adenine(1519)-N(6))-dimethyltransferase RsmA [Chloroflexi bacterium]|nr:16S rRNA (adenine(1518)-N(6)/adenine(1519)-N(6))-dimethyltransferase RsmA [Chloroflexota bacterium]
MNLSSPAVVSGLLGRYGLRSRRRLGQHFLVDANTLQRIVSAADLDSTRPALEIGPGLGTLTRELASRSLTVTAVEYDRSLLPVLRETLAGFDNVNIIQRDAVRLLESSPIPDLFHPQMEKQPDDPVGRAPAAKIVPGSVSCVSNLPYSITSPAIIALLEQKQWLRSITLMIQAEVADRLAAAPGSRDYGALTVFASYHSRVEIVMRVSRNSFHPPPEVDSAVVRLTPLPQGAVPVHSPARLFSVSRALFGQRRKICSNALQTIPGMPGRDTVLDALRLCGIDAEARGETLSLQEMAAIADALPDLPRDTRQPHRNPHRDRRDETGPGPGSSDSSKTSSSSE